MDFKVEVGSISKKPLKNFAINGIVKMLRLHKALAGGHGGRIGPLLNLEGAGTVSEEETLKLDMDNHFLGATLVVGLTTRSGTLHVE